MVSLKENADNKEKKNKKDFKPLEKVFSEHNSLDNFLATKQPDTNNLVEFKDITIEENKEKTDENICNLNNDKAQEEETIKKKIKRKTKEEMKALKLAKTQEKVNKFGKMKKSEPIKSYMYYDKDDKE